MLFTLYVDQSLLRLRNTGVGCHIENVFTGGLGYADILLLVPSVYSLRSMLIVCDNFDFEYKVPFIPDKYHLLNFTKS